MLTYYCTRHLFESYYPPTKAPLIYGIYENLGTYVVQYYERGDNDTSFPYTLEFRLFSREEVATYTIKFLRDLRRVKLNRILL